MSALARPALLLSRGMQEGWVRAGSWVLLAAGAAGAGWLFGLSARPVAPTGPVAERGARPASGIDRPRPTLAAGTRGIEVAVEGSETARAALPAPPERVSEPREEAPAAPESGSPLARFRGRALAGLDGRPIPGARVVAAAAASVQDAPPLAVADAAGEFALPVRPDDELFALAAEGFGPALFAARAPQDEDAPPRALELLPAAGLVARAVGASAEAQGARLGVRAARADLAVPDELGFAEGEFAWSADFERGRARVDGLPARVPLRVELRRPGAPARALASLVLEPGEERVLDWEPLAGIALHGRAVDGSGAPADGIELWLASSASARSTARPAYFAPEDEPRVVARATTGDDGRFRFDSLEAGRYWIGPAPMEGSDASPLARAVELDAERASEELVFVVARGLWIEGRVELANGEPVENAFVWAQSEGVAGPIAAQSDAQGAFRVGPLADLEHRLVARTFEGGSSRASSEVAAHPGDEEVVLRFGEGGKLEGEVIDARSGERFPSRVSIASAALASFSSIEAPDGRFRFDGLAPGRYLVCASTASGLVALEDGIEIAPGVGAAPLVLRLEPGAHLRVERGGGDGPASVQVKLDGALVQFAELAGSAPRTLVVPPGALEVELAPHGSPVERRRVVLARGEELALRFDLRD